MLILTAGFAMQAQADSIALDGSFESPTASFGVYTGDLGDGWTVTSGDIQVLNIPFGEGAVPQSGNKMVYLDFGNGVNTISQTLTTVVGQSYDISYWVADNDPNSLSASFGDQNLFTGFAPTNGVGLAGDYVNYTSSATATSTSTTLSFSGQWFGGDGTLLDDVSVTSSAAPEPVTLGFTALGCLALFAVRRKASLATGSL